MNNLRRVYRHYKEWEELRHNMWGDAENKKAALAEAAKFTGDHKLYGKYMMRVVREWPVSCENALTDYSRNRKAWVGHAAVALARGIPESIVREAWGNLTNEQRFLANQEAARAIFWWEKNYRKDQGVPEAMDEPLLL